MSGRPDPRIAIVGAGPAGLTLAYFLHRLGLTSVRILDAQPTLGGQSVTPDVDGFPVEMGTVYLTEGYVLAKRIAREVGCPAEVLPPATVIDERGRVVHPEPPPTGLVARYVIAWLRWYMGGQMRRPTRADNGLSFAGWLDAHGLGELTRSFVFTAGMTAQLYGPLDAVSAHSALSWMRPSLLRTGRRQQTAWLPAGFQNMWKKLAAHLGYPVQLGQRVDTVRPVPRSGGRRVELLLEGRRIAEPFDHVFLACPLDCLETHPLEGVSSGALTRIAHPLSDALRHRFSSFESTEVYSAAWRARGWPRHAPSRCYLPAASTSERDPLLTIRQYGRTGDRFVGQLCSYAIADDPQAADEDRLDQHPQRLAKNRDQVISDMCSIVGLRDVEIVHERLWRYNVRYSRAQIAEGLPGFIDDAQGARNVWYTGGALSHWNIDAITDFNHALAGRFARRIGLSMRARRALWSPSDLLRDL